VNKKGGAVGKGEGRTPPFGFGRKKKFFASLRCDEEKDRGQKEGEAAAQRESEVSEH